MRRAVSAVALALALAAPAARGGEAGPQEPASALDGTAAAAPGAAAAEAPARAPAAEPAAPPGAGRSWRDAPSYGVSPQLPPEHWAVRAAVRLDALGLVTAYLPAQQGAPLLAVWAALDEGARRAEAERSAFASTARAWRERFLEEWRGVEEKGLWRFLGGQASAGYGWAGVSPAPASPPPLPWSLWPPDTSDPFVSATAAGALSEYLALGLTPVATPWQIRWAGELLAGVGPVSLSAGRTAALTGLGAPGSGVVFGGAALVDRVEFQTFRPLDIYIGLLTVDVYLGKLGPPRHGEGTLLWSFGLQYQPVPRLTLGIRGAAMMGGETWEAKTGSPFTFGDFLRVLGYQGNGTENNVASVSGRWRLPTESFLPITLYADWGTDDNGGAWFQAPGIDLGVLLPSLPFAPEVSLGVEASFFGTMCSTETGRGLCREPGFPLSWYTHGAYTGGWAAGDSPLGHRMGGNGRELWLHGSADLLDARLRVRGDAFLRNRFVGNLYAPYVGTSGGFDAQLVYRVWLGEIGLAGGLEAGKGWTSGGVGVRGTVFF